jgi:hypothetical protein
MSRLTGRTCIIAGMSTANSLGVSVGVLKISNALSLNVNAWGYTPLITLTQAGQSRSSFVVYHDGFLYLGTGLGDGSNNAANTGIRKYDAQTGTQVSGWNGTGVVLPSDLSNSSRAECIEIDPGYQGSGASLAVLARGRGITFRRSFADGSALPNILSVPSRDCQGGQTPQACATSPSRPKAMPTCAWTTASSTPRARRTTPCKTGAPAASSTSTRTTPSKC